MPIFYDDQQRIFHLSHPCVSLLLSVETLPDGSDTVLFRHFGAPVTAACLSEEELQRDRWISFDTFQATYPFALPTAGHGDFRPPQLSIRAADGCGCIWLSYRGYEIRPGKRALPGLPATYVETPDEAETLCLSFGDCVTGAFVQLEYTLFSQTGAIAVNCQIENRGGAPLTLSQAASVAITLPGSYDFLHLQGAWARECGVERVPPMHGERRICSRRGASSHQHNPFAALLASDTTEHSGEAYGCSLVYSGSYTITADEDGLGLTRLVAGLGDEDFAWQLLPCELFQTPEAVLVYSQQGLNGLSQRYHTLYRERLCRGWWKDKPRPVLFNNWEATYFDFDEAALLRIAGRAKDLGAELFVLDDGWFGQRDDDTSSLGDWFANPRKLPDGLAGLSAKVHQLGLMFGIWLEPEMISRRSELFSAHPDWLLCAPGRPATPSRNQFLLNLSLPCVQDYLIDTLGGLLANAKVDYVKWDMNRNYAELYSAALSDHQQGELAHRCMLGVYRLMDRLTARFPKILFEGCAGGGGRLDPGILYYMPQIWASDNSDAIARLGIQYGASIVYPPSVLCCQVSAVPNHQVARVTSLDTRCKAAMGGVFGCQLDPTALSEPEQRQISAEIALAKEIRMAVSVGQLTRLQSPFQGNLCAWQITCADVLLVYAFQILQIANRLPLRLRLHDLADGVYRCLNDGRLYSAADLCGHGLILPFTRPQDQTFGDFSAMLLRFRRECQ